MNKIFKILIFTFLILTLSGCFNYKEINKYAIVSGVSIDIDEEDSSKYEVGIQIMNAKKDEESNNSLITFYKASGRTIYEALEKIMLDSPKEIYLGHNEVIVFSEEILKSKDPLNYLDYFMRDSAVSKSALVMVSKNDKAYNVLKVITPLETIPSSNLKSSLNIADKFSGTLSMVTIDEFISSLSNDGQEAIIPAVSIEGSVKEGESMDNIKTSDPTTKLKFENLAYFQDNKLKGYLTSDESIGYNFLANIPNQTYLNVKCDDENYATLKISSSKLKEKFTFNKNKPIVTATANASADLLEYNCKADFIENEKYIEKLQKKAEDKIIKIMNLAVGKLYKQNNSDVLNYGFKFNSYKNKEMKSLGYTKKSISKSISFDFDANVKIDSTRLSIKSIKEESSYEQ